MSLDSAEGSLERARVACPEQGSVFFIVVNVSNSLFVRAGMYQLGAVYTRIILGVQVGRCPLNLWVGRSNLGWRLLFRVPISIFVGAIYFVTSVNIYSAVCTIVI